MKTQKQILERIGELGKLKKSLLNEDMSIEQIDRVEEINTQINTLIWVLQVN